MGFAEHVMQEPALQRERRVNILLADKINRPATSRVQISDVLIHPSVRQKIGHASTAHTQAYIDAEDYREKANGVVAGLDI